MEKFTPFLADMIGGIVAGVIVAIGWFITGKLNRANNIDLKRMEYRIKALESFLPVWTEIEKDGAALGKPEVIEKLRSARRSFLLFAATNDIELLEALVVAVERKDLAAANKALPPVVSLLEAGIRSELRVNA